MIFMHYFINKERLVVMRKVAIAIVSLISALLLVSCNSTTNNTTSNNDGKETKSNSSSPIIDPNLAIDERKEIENMIEEQKDLLKLGFVTDDNLIDNIQISRAVTFHEDDYARSEDDRVSYSSWYTARSSNPDIQYSGSNHFICEDGLDESTSDLTDRQSFNNDGKEGFYGHIEYEASEIVVKYKDKCYSGLVSTEEGYDEEDKRLLELISKTFKTEAEGAYDPFYKRFTMDLEKIKFPMMNQERVTLWGTSISYWEEIYEENYSRVGVSYSVDDDDYIDYEVTDNEKIYGDIEKKKLKTDGGTSVIVYEDSTSDHRLKYRWSDGTYHYLIEVHAEDTRLSDNDVLVIIDSAMGDDRSFNSLDFFKGVNDAPNLNKDDLELQKYFIED